MRFLQTDLISYYFACGAGEKPFETKPDGYQFDPADVFEPAPLPPPIEPADLPFAPVDPQRARQALEAFHDERKGPHIGLDAETGLPAYLYGDLADPVSGDLLEASAAFLAEHEPLLAGSSGEAVAQPLRLAGWSCGATHVTWRQTNSAGVPVYGAAITLTYSGRHLTFIANTLHSARREELDALKWDESWPDCLEANGQLQGLFPAVQTRVQGDAPRTVAFELVSPPHLQRTKTVQGDAPRIVAFEPPRDLQQESAGRGWRADRWILPLVPPQPRITNRRMMAILRTNARRVRPVDRGAYRPVWRTVGVDVEGRRWLLLVDAETSEVLAAELADLGFAAGV